MPTCPNCSHTFDETPFIPGGFNRAHESFLALVDNVLAYVRSSGTPVLSDDDPVRREIGFCTPSREQRWFIPLTRLKNDLANESERLSLYRSYLGHAAGRAVIASMWGDGTEPTEPFRGAA